MEYDKNKLPDFYSVRDYEQIDYSLSGMERKKCFCFFDNGFSSSVIEPNKRDIKFLWDGFLLIVDSEVTLDDLRSGINLYDARLIALQRTNILGSKSNDTNVRKYILNALESKKIKYVIMDDERHVDGYPSKCDLWSTRDLSVLLDAIDCVGLGEAYFFQNTNFKFEISFNKSGIPKFVYSHQGALVLRGENSTAIARLICNDSNLHDYIEGLVGSGVLYSYIEGRFLPGVKTSTIENKLNR